MPPEQFSDFSVAKLVAGALGSLASLKFMPGPPVQRFTSFVGGSALAYYGADLLVQWLGASSKAEGLAGFMIGMLGLIVLYKAYAIIEAVDATKAAADVWERVTRVWR